MANSVDPEQTAPIGAVCSGSTLAQFLQQTTFSDAFFFLALYRLIWSHSED